MFRNNHTEYRTSSFGGHGNHQIFSWETKNTFESFQQIAGDALEQAGKFKDCSKALVNVKPLL